MEGFYSGSAVRFSIIAQDRYGRPINLTGASVKFVFQCQGLAAQERTATITDPTYPQGGKAEYWTDGADLTAGHLWWEWHVYDSLSHGTVGPFPRSTGEVVDPLVPIVSSP